MILLCFSRISAAPRIDLLFCSFVLISVPNFYRASNRLLIYAFVPVFPPNFNRVSKLTAETLSECAALSKRAYLKHVSKKTANVTKIYEKPAAASLQRRASYTRSTNFVFDFCTHSVCAYASWVSGSSSSYSRSRA